MKLPAEDRQKYGEDKVGKLIQSMYETQDASHIWQLAYVNLICSESGGFRRGKHSAALLYDPKEDERMAVYGDDFVCLSDDEGHKHIDKLPKSTYTAKVMETLGFEDSDAKSLLLLNRVFRVWTDDRGQYLDIEPDLRHAPLIINESGCNTKTKSVTAAREKLQDKVVLNGRKSQILKKEDATRYRSPCMRLSYLAHDRLDLAETAKHLAQQMSEPRELDFVPLKRAARYLVGKPRASLRFRRQEQVDKITVFVDPGFAGDPVSRKRTTGVVARVGNHALKAGSTPQSPTALSVGEAEFYAVVKGSQVGLSFEIHIRGFGNSNASRDTKRQLYSKLFDRSLRCRTSHIGTRYFGVQERVLDGDLTVKKRVPTAKKIVQMWERSQSLHQYYNHIAHLQDWYAIDRGTHTPLPELSRRRR